MNQVERRSNGRPTKTQQLHIQSTLREYYERGMSAVFTSKKTRINIKTVCNYFNEWTNELIHIEETDFVLRQHREKERSIINLEYMIHKMYEHLELIDDEIKNYKKEKKPVPPHLFSSKLQTLCNIKDMTQTRGALGMSPTIDFNLQEYAAEMDARKEGQVNTHENINYYKILDIKN